MSYQFSGSIPTKGETEKLRLALSTYQDGTGQLVFTPGQSLPGWRDFERSVALAFDGVAQESKAIFDVLVPLPDVSEITYGISCKMRETLTTVENTGRVTVEVSNSAGKFWDALNDRGIDNYDADPSTAGRILLELVESWHNEVSLSQGGNVDVSKSFFLLLQWHKRTGRYQFFQFPTLLPSPDSLSWKATGRRLIGTDDEGVMIKWYGYSGGQLKYYPLAQNAIWKSDIFKLEPLPDNELGYGLRRRVIEYFPDLWQKASKL